MNTADGDATAYDSIQKRAIRQGASGGSEDPTGVVPEVPGENSANRHRGQVDLAEVRHGETRFRAVVRGTVKY